MLLEQPVNGIKLPEIVIGVDPGKTGGIAFIPFNGSEFKAVSFPLPVQAKTYTKKGNEINVDSLHALVMKHCTGVVVRLCMIEAVGNVRAKQGVGSDENQRNGATSMFNFGDGFGSVRTLCRLTFGSANVCYVWPMTWQRKVLTGPSTLDTKLRAISYAQRRFPEISLLPTKRHRKPHIGMADAICIASYAEHILLR